jgi:hypothetical protein
LRRYNQALSQSALFNVMVQGRYKSFLPSFMHQECEAADASGLA